MKKIVKPGAILFSEATCQYCSCVFTFEKSDLKINITLQLSVTCPHCDNVVKIKKDAKWSAYNNGC